MFFRSRAVAYDTTKKEDCFSLNSTTVKFEQKKN